MASLVDRILGPRHTEQRGFSDVPKRSLGRVVIGGTPAGNPRGMEAGIKSIEQNPWLFASVNLIARTCASVPWVCYRRKDKKAITRLMRQDVLRRIARGTDQAELLRLDLEETDHPLLVILSKPNPLMNPVMFWRVCWALYELSGMCLAIKDRGRDGKVRALYPFPRTWVNHWPSADEPYYEINTTRSSLGVFQGKIEERDVFVFSEAMPRDPYGQGYGLASVIGAEIDVDEYASNFLGSYFRNSARPDLLIGVDDATEEELDVASERWSAANRGAENTSRVHWYSGDLQVHQIGQGLKDQQLVEIRTFERNTIIQVNGIPPECLGIIENSNRSTIDAADYHLRKNVIAPRMVAMAAALQDQILEEWNLPGLIAPVNPIPEDQEHKLKVAQAAPQALTFNEWRALSGHPPIPGGDVPYVETTYQSGYTDGDQGNAAGSGRPQAAGADDSAPGAKAGKGGSQRGESRPAGDQ